jgi:hypothetical protein
MPQVPDRSTLYHFTVSTTRGPAQDDVATLLRHVADALDGLGALDVHDITFHVDWNEQGPWPSMTVYYEVDEDDEDDNQDDNHDDDVDHDVDHDRAPTEHVDEDAEEATSEAPELDGDRGSALQASVFALDQTREPFVGRGAQTADENGSRKSFDTIVDVTAVEAAEQEPGEHASTEAHDSPTENGAVPVAASIPVLGDADDVLPAATTFPTARPLSSFPVRAPLGVDRPTLRRLKELWRQTSRRRSGP